MLPLEENPHPLVFKAAKAGVPPSGPAPSEDRIDTRTRVRSLTGMQKEMIVEYGPTGTVWRLASDEGAGLNGTDLAPFPLAFFNAGLLSSYMSEVLALAEARGLDTAGIDLSLNNSYAMQGSATAGTIQGASEPVELHLSPPSGADPAAWMEILRHAVVASPADAVMRIPLTSRFSLTCNGERIATNEVPECTDAVVGAGADLFDPLAPGGGFADDIIQKVVLDVSDTPSQAPGSGLNPNQKRSFLVGGSCSITAAGLKEICVRHAMRTATAFHFLSDTSARFGGKEMAPPGLVLLAAGIGFCYMTQLARFAKMAKQDLKSYAITQDMWFGLPGASGGTDAQATAGAAVTHVHLEMGADADARLVTDMAARMCFLHSACAASLKTKVSLAGVEAAA
jgi:organic hydroperoxide reductase OsmC/OhrA